MADKPTYYELLKHPLWQQKRLEVMSLANFECSQCGSKEKTLNVHHSYYEKGLKPWDYPTESLHCLCEDCHRSAQNTMTLLHRSIGRLDLGDIDVLYGFALGLESMRSIGTPIDVYSYEVARGVSLAWGDELTPEEIIAALTERQIEGAMLAILVAKKQRTLKAK